MANEKRSLEANSNSSTRPPVPLRSRSNTPTKTTTTPPPIPVRPGNASPVPLQPTGIQQDPEQAEPGTVSKLKSSYQKNSYGQASSSGMRTDKEKANTLPTPAKTSSTPVKSSTTAQLIKATDAPTPGKPDAREITPGSPNGSFIIDKPISNKPKTDVNAADNKKSNENTVSQSPTNSSFITHVKKDKMELTEDDIQEMETLLATFAAKNPEFTEKNALFIKKAKFLRQELQIKREMDEKLIKKSQDIKMETDEKRKILTETIDAQTNELISLIYDKNYVKLREKLSMCGYDPNKISSKKMIPLHVAIIRGDLEAVRVLLENGAEPEKLRSEKRGLTALHVAFDMPVQEVSEDIVGLLLAKMNPTAKDNGGKLAKEYLRRSDNSQFMDKYKRLLKRFDDAYNDLDKLYDLLASRFESEYASQKDGQKLTLYQAKMGNLLSDEDDIEKSKDKAVLAEVARRTALRMDPHKEEIDTRFSEDKKQKLKQKIEDLKKQLEADAKIQIEEVKGDIVEKAEEKGLLTHIAEKISSVRKNSFKKDKLTSSTDLKISEPDFKAANADTSPKLSGQK